MNEAGHKSRLSEIDSLHVSSTTVFAKKFVNVPRTLLLDDEQDVANLQTRKQPKSCMQILPVTEN